jgi:GcrA cell cycle regulator
MNPWNDEQVALLKQGYANGLSHTLIASQLWQELRMSVSRNAVIGKCNRLGLPRRRSSVKIQGQGAGPRRSRAASNSDRRTTQRIRLGSVVLLPEPEMPSPEHLGIAFFDLNANHCRFPQGEGLAATYCGHSVISEGPYCAFHHRLCYARPEDRRERRAA